MGPVRLSAFHVISRQRIVVSATIVIGLIAETAIINGRA
jgi:hypothetical protein